MNRINKCIIITILWTIMFCMIYFYFVEEIPMIFLSSTLTSLFWLFYIKNILSWHDEVYKTQKLMNEMLSTALKLETEILTSKFKITVKKEANPSSKTVN